MPAEAMRSGRKPAPVRTAERPYRTGFFENEVKPKLNEIEFKTETYMKSFQAAFCDGYDRHGFSAFRPLVKTNGNAGELG
jgi:hypothetical protein